jgi:hypothetical protein
LYNYSFSSLQSTRGSKQSSGRHYSSSSSVEACCSSGKMKVLFQAPAVEDRKRSHLEGLSSFFSPSLFLGSGNCLPSFRLTARNCGRARRRMVTWWCCLAAAMATGGEAETRVKAYVCGRPGWLICTRTTTRGLSIQKVCDCVCRDHRPIWVCSVNRYGFNGIG